MHIYVDESGDTGFKFGAGSSAYFVVAIVFVPDIERALDAMEALRESLNEPTGHEFKFARMPPRLRVAVLPGLASLGITSRVLVVDKRCLVAPELREHDAFHKYLMQTSLEVDSGEIVAARLVIDQSFKGKAKQADLATHLRRGLNAQAAHTAKCITKVMYHESHRDQLRQVADVIAGAVAPAYEQQDTEYRILIEDLIAVPGQSRQ